MTRARKTRQRSMGISVRVALAAAVITAILTVSGAFVMRAVLYATRMNANVQLALVQADQIFDLTIDNNQISGDYGPLPYQIVRSDGIVVSESSSLPPGTPLGPLPRSGDTQFVGWHWSLRVPDGTQSPYAGQTLTAVSDTLDEKNIQDVASGQLPEDATVGLRPGTDPESLAYRIYVFATPSDADAAVAAVDPYLWSGVLLVIALVAATSALAARRALRPVTQIRDWADRIAEAGSSERITAWDRDDELAALAATLNSMLDRLHAADLAQRRFIADAAHELRSPISSLLTALEIAKAHPTALTHAETIEHATVEARRLQALADDLLAFTPRDQGGRGDVGEALGAVIDAARGTGTGAQISLQLHGRDKVIVPLSERKLEQVFDNLLSNALRHADSAVVVTVDVAEETQTPERARSIRVTISNDGPPIPEDEYDRIFEPFVRLDESRARATGGAGLGLTIARDIVTRAGGRISVSSTAEWTEFTVTLPALDLERASAR